jgi:hypothetical protein
MRFRLFTLGTLLLAACFAHAGIIDYIATGSSYKYCGTDSAHACPSTVGFQNLSYNDSAWFTGNAPFGNTSGGDFGANTNWTVDFDPLLRTTFVLGTPVNMTANIGVDNGYALYVNGTLISSNNAEGFTSRWEYVINIPSTYFVSGTNIIAVALEDHGGLTAFDMELTGDSSGLNRTVPEPASLVLLGSGLLGIGTRMRRRK